MATLVANGDRLTFELENCRKMEESPDIRLLNNICASLKSEDVETIVSTGNFLETVVVHDFPANVFLHSRDLISCLLKLCRNTNEEISNVAFSCLSSICNSIVIYQMRLSDPRWKTAKEILSSRLPGDGIEEESLLLCSLACTLAEKCKQIIFETDIPFDKIFKLLVEGSRVLLISRSPSECLTFCDTLSDILSALRLGCRRHFVSVVLLFGVCLRACPPSLLVEDIINQVYQILIDASIIHHHSELTSFMTPILKNDTMLLDKYQSLIGFYQHFRYLAQFIKYSDRNSDLAPILHLMELDEPTALSICPYVFKKIKQFGANPAVAVHLLTTQPHAVLSQVYCHLTEMISPVKTSVIDSKMGDLLVDENVIGLVTSNLYSDCEEVALNAEKLLTLLIKGNSWMKATHWQKLIDSIVPKLLLDVEQDMPPSENQRIHVLASVLWDLIYQSILPAENQPKSLDLHCVLLFLIRNLTRDITALRDKCSSNLVAILCQQAKANQLRPRIAALDSDMLTRLFETQVNMITNTAAKFPASTILETLDHLKGLDVSESRSHLMELAIILEDNSLHEIFLNADGLAMLKQLLQKALAINDDPLVEEFCDSVIASIVNCLLNLASSGPNVQKQLASDNEVLMNLLRASMLTWNDLIARRHCAALLQLVSQVPERKPVAGPEVSRAPSDWSQLWSKNVVRTSAKFVFHAEFSQTPGGHVPSFMKLTEDQLEHVKAANELLLVEDALQKAIDARSHEDIHSTLSILREILERPGLEITRSMVQLKWREAFETFFRVLPESADDEDVFIDVLDTLAQFSRRAATFFQNIDDIPLFQWVLYILTNEKHVFWVLFQDKCFSHNRAGSCEKLWPHLLRFVSSTMRIIYAHPSVSLPANSSMTHVLGILCSVFEQDDQSQVYELNSLKLMLDCLIHTTAALLRRRQVPKQAEKTVIEHDAPVVTSLLLHVTQTVGSFISGKHDSNKGRSVVQCCSQLIGHLVALLPPNFDCPAYQDLSWLIRLIQYPDPIVKSAALEILCQISFAPEVSVYLTDVFSLLADPEESCCVLEQVTWLISRNCRRATEDSLLVACRMMSSPQLRVNQPFLRSLGQMLANVINPKMDGDLLQIVVNEAVPSLPDLLTHPSTQKAVKSQIFSILRRVAILHSNVGLWLFKQIECVSAAVQCLTSQPECDPDPDHADLVTESSSFLAFLLHSETDRTWRVAHSLLSCVEQFWNFLLPYVYEFPIDSAMTASVFLFLKLFLVASIRSDQISKLKLQEKHLEALCRWILPQLSAKINESTSQSFLQVVGLFLNCCPNVDDRTSQILNQFLVSQLKFVTLSEKSLVRLLEVAYNLLLANPGSKQSLLEQGIPLADLWNRTKKMPAVLRPLIRLGQLLVVDPNWPEMVRHLFKNMLEYLEEKENQIMRQSALIEDEDWPLIELIYELLVGASCSSEGRRLMVKSRFWSQIHTNWHPVYWKRIRGRQQQVVHSTLTLHRAKLLSALTFYSEPILPDLLDGRAVQTLMDLASEWSSPAQEFSLSIIRNMAFNPAYRGGLLAAGIVPSLVRILTSEEAGDGNVRTVLGALLALSANNQRVKGELRSMLDNWFRRNLPVGNDEPNDPQSLPHLYQNLWKWIDG